MTERYKFSHNAADYEVLGNYGLGNKFTITKFQAGATRMLRSSPGAASGIVVEALISDVETQGALLAELKNKFPGLSGFGPF